jgi:hypothetical protein
MNSLNLNDAVSLVTGGVANVSNLGSIVGLSNNNSDTFQDTRMNTPTLVIVVLLLILVWVALIYSTYNLVGKDYRVLHTVMTGLFGGLYVVCLWIFNGAVMKRSIRK